LVNRHEIMELVQDMQMSDTSYRYEVAFSFLKQDEQYATKLNELLQERFSTFLYSKRQGELVGADGEETFNQVFGVVSRCVVVFYRKEWGTTPWTRIEETAIRNRAYEYGYDFLTVVPLDKPPTVPLWLPKTRIWANLERWGVEGLASVIEARIVEVGGVLREETLQQRIERQRKEIEAEGKRKKFLSSDDGVRTAVAEVERLFSELEKISNDILPSLQGIKIRVVAKERQCAIDTNVGISILLDWSQQYSNVLDGASLKVSLWRSNDAPLFGRSFIFQDPKRFGGDEYKFDVDWSSHKGWRGQRNNKFTETNALAEYCMKLLMDEIHRARVGKN
jgi:hypothetical protein